MLLILLVQFSGVYINYLWFGAVGHRDVYSTMFWTRVMLFVVFGVLMALIIGGNLVVAYLIRPPFRPMSAEQQNLQNYVRDGRAAAQARAGRRHGLIALLAAGRVGPGRLADVAAVAATAVRSASDGPAVPPGHQLLRLGLPGLPHCC